MSISFPDYKTYTREEEHDVFLKIRAGEAAAKKLKTAAPADKITFEKIVEEGKAARKDMLLHNIRLAYNYVLKYCCTFTAKRPDCTDDLIMSVILGINHAIDLFNVDSGYKFSTYAYQWMHNYANNYMYRESYLLGYNNGIYMIIDKYKKFCSEYQMHTGNLPDEKTILLELGINENTLKIVENALAEQIDLDFEINDGTAVGELIDSGYDVERSAVENILRDKIRSNLSILTRNERKLIELHYGFGNYEPCSILAAEKKMGLSRGSGNIILKRAHKKLLHSLS